MLYLLLVLSLILCCVAATQNGAIAQVAPPAAVSSPVPPPLPPNPVDTFRRILAMSEPEREKFLATYAPNKREVVINKLVEYQGLSAEDRENRLRGLQARVWVRQLIRMAPSNRIERLATIAPAERELVQARLADWDRLPADLQKEILASELAIRSIAQSPDYMSHVMPPLPVKTPATAMRDHWLDKSEAERAEILSHFETFFETVSAKERAKIMADRPEMIAKAAPIERLAKEQRERYIAGFKRFTSLTPTERQRFLINVSHWQKMTPEQRDSWRVLAKKLSPPSAPPPVPGRPTASTLPTFDHADADLPSR